MLQPLSILYALASSYRGAAVARPGMAPMIMEVRVVTVQPDRADLLHAYQQSEVALEAAMRSYQEAATQLQQAKPAERARASYELSLALKEMVRLRARRQRLQAEIAHARAAAGRSGAAPSPPPIASGPESGLGGKAPSRRAAPRR